MTVPPWSGARMMKVVAEQKRIHAHRNSPCFLCGQSIDYRALPDDLHRFSVEHIIPRSIRPDLTWEPSNWAPAHMDCNKRKGNRDAPPPLGKPSRNW